MMDHLSRGRLELGLSRGASQFEMASYGVTAEESRGRFNEALEILLQGLSTGQVNHEGRFYSYKDVQTRLRPVQKPYPPLWYPTSNVESIPYIASQGMSAIFALHLAPSLDAVWQMLAVYRQHYEMHRDEAKRLNSHVAEPNFGFAAHVHVAETDEQAIRQARESWKHFFENFSYLWVKHGMGDRYANRSDFDQLLGEGKMLVGSPATVRERLKSHVQAAGGNYVVGSFSWGNFTPAQVLTSVDLFAREVMPYI
jgi:alkanesulfonate monooxygenase SsuD/methylene tetrahydromethanopterin reductase-like flavin-dependent oxidoreductase (luciferase family)